MFSAPPNAEHIGSPLDRPNPKDQKEKNRSGIFKNKVFQNIIRLSNYIMCIIVWDSMIYEKKKKLNKPYTSISICYAIGDFVIDFHFEKFFFRASHNQDEKICYLPLCEEIFMWMNLLNSQHIAHSSLIYQWNWRKVQ